MEEKKQRIPAKAPRISIIEMLKLAALCIITIIIVHAAYAMSKNAILSKKSTAEYQQKLSSLNDQKSFLENTLLQMDSEEGREIYIRKELRVVKPGEQMFIIQD